MMITTHYQELKLYATEHPEVENASCEFDLVHLKPTYRLILGSPGKSNAFAITEGLGMDPSIIQQAQTLVSEENLRFERAVEKLEQTRQTLEDQLQAIQVEKQQADEAAAKAKQELEEIRAERAEKSNRLACKPCRLSSRPVQNPTPCWKNWTSCEKKKNGRHSLKMLSLQNPAANGDSAICTKRQTHSKKPLQQMLLTSCRER